MPCRFPLRIAPTRNTSGEISPTKLRYLFSCLPVRVEVTEKCLIKVVYEKPYAEGIMLGAIVGDIIGSIRENLRIKRKDFTLYPTLCTFTDDTVLTVAVADAILNGKRYGTALKAYARRHPFRGYGPRFLKWMISPGFHPYNSLGNGSAMRVSPVAHAYNSIEAVLHQAEASAACTHNHPEGIKGAQATALAVFLARTGAGKEEIRRQISDRFGYRLDRSIDAIRPGYRMDITCPGSVPEAIIAFLDAADFEDAVRNAVSLGGDADTQAAIAGAIAEAYYQEVPGSILETAWKKIPRAFKEVIVAFAAEYGSPRLPRNMEYGMISAFHRNNKVGR